MEVLVLARKEPLLKNWEYFPITLYRDEKLWDYTLPSAVSHTRHQNVCDVCEIPLKDQAEPALTISPGTLFSACPTIASETTDYLRYACGYLVSGAILGRVSRLLNHRCLEVCHTGCEAFYIALASVPESICFCENHQVIMNRSSAKQLQLLRMQVHMPRLVKFAPEPEGMQKRNQRCAHFS
jgi:hypothetical protein